MKLISVDRETGSIVLGRTALEEFTGADAPSPTRTFSCPRSCERLIQSRKLREPAEPVSVDVLHRITDFAQVEAGLVVAHHNFVCQVLLKGDKKLYAPCEVAETQS